MKNSKQYSQKIQKLYRLLKREYPKPKMPEYEEPLDALVYAIVSDNMNQTAAQSAIKSFTDYFVDWNDLRVSRKEEIIEALGGDALVAGNIASILIGALASIFEKNSAISLQYLKKLGKRPARQALEKIDGVSNFVVNYCMLAVLHGHAIPLTKKMMRYLAVNQLVNPDANQQEVEGFLARQISAKDAYEFYALLRRQSESPRAKITREVAPETKTRVKTKKKTKKVKTKKVKAKKAKTKN